MNKNINIDLSQGAVKFEKRDSETLKKEPKAYFQFPVYKKEISLIKQLYASTQKTPKSLKYGLVKDIETEIIQSIHLIRQAADTSDKVELINQAYEKAKYVQTMIRVIDDLRGFSPRGFAVLSSLSEDVVRQLAGWYKSQNKELQ